MTSSAASPAGRRGSAQGATARRRYSAATATRVVEALRDLERIEDVVTISAIARRTGVSRPTVRAVLQQECGWTMAESRRAHHAGVRRGKLLQAVAGHPGLARGRATLEIQGWPQLARVRQSNRASASSALQRGRVTQAECGWPGLAAARDTHASAGYPHLSRGRANLAARGWPNGRRAQDTLKAQDYLPLVEARRLRRDACAASPVAESQIAARLDRRRARSLTTQLAILEALQRHEVEAAENEDLQRCYRSREGSGSSGSNITTPHVTAQALAAQLHLHPATVYAHLKRLKQVMLAQEVTAQEVTAQRSSEKAIAHS